MEEQNYPQQKQYDKGSAPKITREMVKANIWYYACVNAYEAAKAAQTGQGAPSADLLRVTLCLMTLRNGAVIVGSSTCAHQENFDQSKGESAAYDDAFRQAWNLMGYALRDRLGTMSHYQGLDGVTRDADGEESFEQLKWNAPQGGLPYKNHIKIEAGEPSPGSTQAAMDIGKVLSGKQINPDDIKWIGIDEAAPTPEENVKAKPFFKGIEKPVGTMYNVRMEGGVWKADLKVDEEAKRQSEIDFLKIFGDPALPFIFPTMKPPRLTDVLKASREYEASRPRPGHADSSASVQYKAGHTHGNAERNAEEQYIGMRESFDKIIRNMTEEIAAAYRVPVRMLLGDMPKDAPKKAADEISFDVTFVPANDGETLEEVKKRVSEAIQSVIEGYTKKVKHLPAIAKGAHVALHGGKADPYPMDLPELVEAYFLGYNMVYRSGDYGLEWDKRVHAITRQYACLADQRAESQFIELVQEYMAKP